jgi:hypothetical protein
MKGQNLPLNGATQFKEFLSDFPNTHNIRDFIKVALYSPCLWASFHPLSPLFERGPQSKKVL